VEIVDCKVLGVRTSRIGAIQKPLGDSSSTLADIKKVIQPMLSKWAAVTDLAIMRQKWENGELPNWPQPKRGSKNWLSLRSNKKMHIFEIGTQSPNEDNRHNIELKRYAQFLEEFIELNFGQTVPVVIGMIPAYASTVTSGESSSTVFRGEELTDDPEEWF
jgi:hypothetical protein